MEHLCEMLSRLGQGQRFRVTYCDYEWNELVNLRMEHARPEFAYSALGVWLLVKSAPGYVEPSVATLLENVTSVTVEVENG